MMEFFSHKKVQSYKWVREEEIALTIEKISSASSVGEPVDIRELMINLTNDIYCRCALGRKHGGPNGDLNFGVIAGKVMKMLVAFSFADLYPWFGWMDHFTGFIRRINKLSKELGDFFDQIMDEHIRQNKHNDPNYEKDYVDILLQVQMKNSIPNFTRDNIKALILDNFVAGTETTSTTIEWALAELMKSPQMMQKAQEEVRRVVGNKNKVDEEDIQGMDYLKAVVKENLRLHPSVALLPMQTSVATNLKGYHVPAKTKAYVNIWSIHRDPKFWEKPEEFNPERFIDNPLDFIGRDFKYIPFGSGRRTCPAVVFGVTAVEVVLANLLYWFDWEMPKGETLDMAEGFGITVNKKIPLHLLPRSHFP
ncbi:Cytochrome p450 [Thalictrum thalictroides]|uniref:Cytochrome p450 n=1 Tax=Thalictrum thalictroides TaxID=46969 RepID=A0A7J6X0G5_THATH|nr:Cytochrome p450 [Thalictrum thalictroides]